MFQHYLPVLYVILILLVVLLIVVIPTKKSEKKAELKPTPKAPHIITSQDIKAIAGDDEIVTQLDLARAYIEMDKKIMAQQLLQYVMQHGNPTQQQEARQLLETV